MYQVYKDFRTGISFHSDSSILLDMGNCRTMTDFQDSNNLPYTLCILTGEFQGHSFRMHMALAKESLENKLTICNPHRRSSQLALNTGDKKVWWMKFGVVQHIYIIHCFFRLFSKHNNQHTLLIFLHLFSKRGGTFKLNSNSFSYNFSSFVDKKIYG